MRHYSQETMLTKWCDGQASGFDINYWAKSEELRGSSGPSTRKTLSISKLFPCTVRGTNNFHYLGETWKMHVLCQLFFILKTYLIFLNQVQIS